MKTQNICLCFCLFVFTSLLLFCVNDSQLSVVPSSPLVADSNTSSLTFWPENDAFVNSDFPNDNFGDSDLLALGKGTSGTQKNILFSFSFPNRSYSYTNAVIGIYFIPSSSSLDYLNLFDVYLINSTLWTEHNITWNNLPVRSQISTFSIKDGLSRFYYLNVSNYIQNRTSLSIMISPATGAGSYYNVVSKDIDLTLFPKFAPLRPFLSIDNNSLVPTPIPTVLDNMIYEGLKYSFLFGTILIVGFILYQTITHRMANVQYCKTCCVSLVLIMIGGGIMGVIGDHHLVYHIGQGILSGILISFVPLLFLYWILNSIISAKFQSKSSPSLSKIENQNSAPGSNAYPLISPSISSFYGSLLSKKDRLLTMFQNGEKFTAYHDFLILLQDLPQLNLQDQRACLDSFVVIAKSLLDQFTPDFQQIEASQQGHEFEKSK